MASADAALAELQVNRDASELLLVGPVVAAQLDSGLGYIPFVWESAPCWILSGEEQC